MRGAYCIAVVLRVTGEQVPAILRIVAATTPAGALARVLGASVVVLGAALLSQYVGGLEPCVLCLYQRVPYVLAIAVCALALLFMAVWRGPGKPLVGGALALCGAIFLAGAAIAAFHVGVEQGWWQGTAGCTGPDTSAMTIDELREHLLAAPVVRCDEVAWSLFGISMAGYNLLVSLALAVVSARFAGTARRGSAG